MKKQYVKPLKLFLISVIAIITMMVSTVFASADTPVVQVASKGDAVLPYFEINGTATFCLESVVTRPTEEHEYCIGEAYENEAVLRLIKNYIALQGTVDDTLLNQVMQQAIWATLDGTTTQRMLVIYRLGKNGADIYDSLVNSEFDIEDTKVIKMTVYFEETGQYQKLMNWIIEDIPDEPISSDTSVSEESVTSKEPEDVSDEMSEQVTPENTTTPEKQKDASVEPTKVPEGIPKDSEVPKTPVVNGPTVSENNAKNPVEHQSVPVDNSNESEIDKDPKDASDKVLDYPIEYVDSPQTGYHSDIAIYGLLLVLSAMGIIILSKKCETNKSN